MKWGEILPWVNEHPGLAILIGGGVVLLLLWLFGFFSRKPQADSGNGMAAAYYNAEAQQAIVGGQIQLASIQATNQTAQVARQASAAEAIAQTQAGAAIQINQQNTGAAQTIAGYQAETDRVLGGYALQATQSNNAAAVATNAASTATAWQIAQKSYDTSVMNNFLSSVIAPEIVLTGGMPFGASVNPASGVFSLGVGGGPPSIDALMNIGYTRDQAEAVARAQSGIPF